MGKIIIKKPRANIIIRPKKIIQKSQIIKKSEPIIYENIDYSNYKIGIFLHLFYLDTFDDFIPYFNNLKCKFTLYVNLVEGYSDHIELINKIKNKYSDSEIIISKNIGKDIGGKLNLLKHLNKTNQVFDFLIFCHDKKSPHMAMNSGLRWRQQLLNGILSEHAILLSISFFNNSNIGMCGSKKWTIFDKCSSNTIYGHIKNKKYLYNLLDLLNIKKINEIAFVGGTMFWVRYQIFKNFFTVSNINKILEKLEYGDVKEPSYAHAVERLFGYLVLTNKYKIKGTV